MSIVWFTARAFAEIFPLVRLDHSTADYYILIKATGMPGMETLLFSHNKRLDSEMLVNNGIDNIGPDLLWARRRLASLSLRRSPLHPQHSVSAKTSKIAGGLPLWRWTMLQWWWISSFHFSERNFKLTFHYLSCVASFSVKQPEKANSKGWDDLAPMILLMETTECFNNTLKIKQPLLSPPAGFTKAKDASLAGLKVFLHIRCFATGVAQNSFYFWRDSCVWCY